MMQIRGETMVTKDRQQETGLFLLFQAAVITQQLVCIFTRPCRVNKIGACFVLKGFEMKPQKKTEISVIFGSKAAVVMSFSLKNKNPKHRCATRSNFAATPLCFCCIDLGGFSFTPGFMWWHLLNQKEPRVFCSRPLSVWSRARLWSQLNIVANLCNYNNKWTHTVAMETLWKARM